MNPITQQELKEFCAARYGNLTWLSRKSGHSASSFSRFIKTGGGMSVHVRVELAQTIAQHKRPQVEANHRMFDGSPCLYCGGTLRYRRTLKCVQCRREQAAERRKAKPEGSSTKYSETRTGSAVHIVHPRRPSRTRCGGAVHHVLSYSAPIHSSSICPRCVKFQEARP